MSKIKQAMKIIRVMSDHHTGNRSEAQRIAHDLVDAGFGDADRFEICSEVDPIYEGGIVFKKVIRPKQYKGE